MATKSKHPATIMALDGRIFTPRKLLLAAKASILTMPGKYNQASTDCNLGKSDCGSQGCIAGHMQWVLYKGKNAGRVSFEQLSDFIDPQRKQQDKYWVWLFNGSWNDWVPTAKNAKPVVDKLQAAYDGAKTYKARAKVAARAINFFIKQGGLK